MHAELSAKLTDVLGDSVALWWRAQSAHWNVTGPHFHAYHELFGEVYEDVWASLDTTAEAIRNLGEFPPSRLSQLLKNEETATDTHDAETLVREVLGANAAVTKCLYSAFDECNKPECNAQGIANYVAGRIEAHEKWSWQLSATLGESPVTAEPSHNDDVVKVAEKPAKKRGAYTPGVNK